MTEQSTPKELVEPYLLHLYMQYLENEINIIVLQIIYKEYINFSNIRGLENKKVFKGVVKWRNRNGDIKGEWENKRGFLIVGEEGC